MRIHSAGMRYIKGHRHDSRNVKAPFPGKYLGKSALTLTILHMPRNKTRSCRCTLERKKLQTSAQSPQTYKKNSRNQHRTISVLVQPFQSGAIERENTLLDTFFGFDVFLDARDRMSWLLANRPNRGDVICEETYPTLLRTAHFIGNLIAGSTFDQCRLRGLRLEHGCFRNITYIEALDFCGAFWWFHGRLSGLRRFE
jgi:hypothetical protein